VGFTKFWNQRAIGRAAGAAAAAAACRPLAWGEIVCSQP